jgi:hypothetical protein
VSSLLEEDKQAAMLSARVGEYVVFDCPLDFPHDYVIPYILRWNKEVRHTQDAPFMCSVGT